jgi:hypothetical protein
LHLLILHLSFSLPTGEFTGEVTIFIHQNTLFSTENQVP